MILSLSDLRHIKWSLLVSLFVLCAGAAMFAVSENFAARAQHEQRTAQRQLNEMRRQLADAGEDRKNIRAYMPEFDELLRRNIIGDGRRLDWIEGLEKIRKQNHVLNFKYAISPQQTYMPPTPLDSGNFDLKLSGMTLQFDLLHEGQLMDFFDTLRADGKGLFLLDHCTLERNAGAGAAVQLKAECAGGWLTLINRNSK